MRSNKNGVTGLHNSYPRIITALKVLLERVSPYVLYGRGSLNISLETGLDW